MPLRADAKASVCVPNSPSQRAEAVAGASQLVGHEGVPLLSAAAAAVPCCCLPCVACLLQQTSLIHEQQYVHVLCVCVCE